VTAETYWRAWQHREEVQGLSEVRRVGWLFGVLNNVMRERWKAQSRRPDPAPLSDARSAQLADSDACVPDQVAMRIAYAKVLNACGRILKDSECEVLVMRLAGYGYREIAAMRGTTPATARGQATRAVKVLRADPDVADVLAQLREGEPTW
jgi:DNA-directed RNA polymerase specialized sigma24 family protein